MLFCGRKIAKLTLSIHILFSEYRKENAKREKMKKIKRYALIGGAGTVGGILIGLTGGLASPLVAAGAGLFVGTGVVAGLATVCAKLKSNSLKI